MKRVGLFLCLLSSYLSCGRLWGAEFYYLPQIADGAFQDGSMRTTFVLFNPTRTAATATIRVTDDQGQALEVTIPGFGTDVHFGPISLAPGQTRVLQTDGTGVLRA